MTEYLQKTITQHYTMNIHQLLYMIPDGRCLIKVVDNVGLVFDTRNAQNNHSPPDATTERDRSQLSDL